MREVRAAGPAAHRHRLPWFKSRHLWLFITLMIYFLLVPMVEQLIPQTRAILDLFILLVMLAAAYTVIGKRKVFVLAVALLAVGLGMMASTFHNYNTGRVVVGCLLYVGFLGIIVYSILREVLTLKEVNFDAISGALSTYLLLGLMWGFAYQVLEAAWPGSFAISGQVLTHDAGPHYVAPHWGALFYFSFVTITTTGYGDVTPVNMMARQLAITEAVVGQFYMVVLVARLVSLHTMRRG